MLKISAKLTNWFLLGPAFLFLAVILGFPLLRGLQLSFTDTPTLNPTESTYVG
jgi:ABC-type sugar transport system permease subunit